MRVKELEPAYRARMLYDVANGFVMHAFVFDRAGRPDDASAKRADARMVRQQARGILEMSYE